MSKEVISRCVVSKVYMAVVNKGLDDTEGKGKRYYCTLAAVAPSSPDTTV